MANTVTDNSPYVSILNLGGTAYTIKDAWARGEIAEIEAAIAGGVHFRGISTTAIADGDALKDLTVGGETYLASDQVDGDMFIYTTPGDDPKNLEFIVANGHYSELGSTGVLGALAFKSSASGSVTVPIATAVSFDAITPDVSTGTLAVTYATGAIEVTTTEDTASGTFTPAAITIPDLSVTITPSTGTFSALSSTVTYDSANETLMITSATSSEFWTGYSEAKAAGQSVTQTENQTITVTYDKATAGSGTFLTSASLTGALGVTASTITAHITDPSITVTVE